MGPGESGETTGIWAISILGGAPRKLKDDAGHAAVSSQDDSVAYVRSRSESEIWIMDGNGANPRQLLRAAPGERFLQVQFSPDGHRIAYTKSHTEGEKSEVRLETVPREGGATVNVLSMPGLRSFCWAADNRIIYSSEEPPPNDKDMNLWAVRVNSTGETRGQPRRITSWAGLSLLDLSISQNGKRLTFVNSGIQQDLYVAEVQSETRLGSPHRLTLEGKNDLPSAWMPDGKALFFHSDRNGNWDIFRQQLGQRKSEDFILGPGNQTDATFTPEDSWVLYWDHAQTSGKPAPHRLMRVPISGGAPEVVLESSGAGEVRCASKRPLCILSEPDKSHGKLIFTRVDSIRGKTGEMFSVAVDPAASPNWDVARDGSAVALVGLDEARDRIRLLDVQTGSARSIPVANSRELTGISWSADGKSWVITSSSVRGAAVLRVILNGTVFELWATTNNLATPLVSPDGKNLAFTVSSRNSNAWMIENF